VEKKERGRSDRSERRHGRSDNLPITLIKLKEIHQLNYLEEVEKDRGARD